MSKTSCLCRGRTDIRCDEEHCDLAGPGQPGNPNECRVCWLRLERFPPSALRSPPVSPERASPCLFLGEVLDALGCSCPVKWMRACEIHKICNIHQCKSCPDYEEA